MVQMKIVYQGEKHCELTHGPSQSKIETDAPKDNQGKGERFSPTDLMGAALGSCILTTMEIVAARENLKVDLKNATAVVEKTMSASPRKIESLRVKLTLPASLTPEIRKRMEDIAHNCPVSKSLHPDIQVPMTFEYV